MQDLANRVPDDGVHHTVDVHALPDGRVRVGDHTFSAKEFADMLRRDPHFDGSKPIRLLSCDAGTSGLARDLANELGTPVTAPRGLAWTDGNGRVFASDMGPDGRPGWPPNGGWDTHHPDGTTTPASNDGFHPTRDGEDPGQRPEDAEARGNSEDQANPQHQLNPRWAEPDYNGPPLRQELPRGESFTNPPRDLEPRRRYDVYDDNGSDQPRSRAYTDEAGRVTHVDAVAPNTDRGINPEVSHPARDADYRVNMGDRHTAYRTDGNGDPATERSARPEPTSRGRQSVVAASLIETPTPSRVEPITSDHPLSPAPDRPFNSREDASRLDPDTRYRVTDQSGSDRGTFQTDGNGAIRWIDTHESIAGGTNPDLDRPQPDTNYRVNRGPQFQEYRVNSDGFAEQGHHYTRPEVEGDPVMHERAVRQNQAFLDQHYTRDGQLRSDRPAFEPESEHQVTDRHDQRRMTFFTDSNGVPTHLELESGQRARMNPEITRAPSGTDITPDGFYGTPRAQAVQDSWPAPNQEVTFHQGARDEAGTYSGDSGNLSQAQEEAISRRTTNTDPIVNRSDLPPNTRIHIVDSAGHPYSTFQTDSNGTVSHVHTGQPFNADFNRLPPNTSTNIDNGREFHATNDRGHTIATSGEVDYSSGTNIRRDESAQKEAGRYGLTDEQGRQLAHGGHHLPTSQGGSGETGNQTADDRLQNAKQWASEEPGFTSQDSYKTAEDRQFANNQPDPSETTPGATGTDQPGDHGDAARPGTLVGRNEAFALFDDGSNYPHTTMRRWHETDENGQVTVQVRSFPSEPNVNRWPDDF